MGNLFCCVQVDQSTVAISEAFGKFDDAMCAYEFEGLNGAMKELYSEASMRLGANEKAEAEKIWLIKPAEGEAEAKYLSASQKQAIFDGFCDRVWASFSANVPKTTAKDVMDTQYFDTMKEIGASSKSSAVFISLSGSSKEGLRKCKSVSWGDKGGDAAFSIGASRMSSLVIGPGSGYNLKSNPLSENESLALADAIGKAKVKGTFQDQLKAEREFFKAVLDKRHVRSHDSEDE